MANRGGYLTDGYPHYHDVNNMGSHPSNFSYAALNDPDKLAQAELERSKNFLKGKIEEKEREIAGLQRQTNSAEQELSVIKSRLKDLQ